MKKRQYIIALILLISIIILSIINILGLEKRAISKLSLSGKKYIICEPILVTGYSWCMIGDEQGMVTPTQVCIVSGADPESELGLKYGFMSMRNKYVFYVTERKEYYSQELGHVVVEYTASGWDIMAPVKHENPFYNLLYPFGIVSQDKN